MKNNHRVCIPAPPPVCCPKCGSIHTQITDGVRWNLAAGRRYDYRKCKVCGFKFATMRSMTAEEKKERMPKTA